MSDISTCSDKFETDLYKFIGNYIIEPSIPDNLDKYKIKIESSDRLIDILRVKLNNFGKLAGYVKRISEFIDIYNYIYANMDDKLFKNVEFYETVKLKLVSFYLCDSSTCYAKKYFKTFCQVYFKLIFSEKIEDYITDIYTNIDNNEHFGAVINYEMRKKIMNDILERDTNIQNKQCHKCLTWEQARDIHNEIMKTFKEKNYKKIYSKEEYVKKITDLNNCIMSRIKSGIYENNLYISQLFEITESFKKNCFEYFVTFGYSDIVNDMRIELLSEYDPKANDRKAIENYHNTMYGWDIYLDVELFKYFVANQHKYSETVVNGMKRIIYEFLMDDIIKENEEKEYDSEINHVKLKIYTNYYFSGTTDEEKELYITCNIALFNSNIELDKNMIIYFAKNMDKFDESIISKLKDHISKKLLDTYQI